MAGRLARVPVPRLLRRPVLGTAALLIGADMKEARRPIGEFGSLDELFVRRLRDGARDWPEDPAVVASPVDGRLGQLGSIWSGQLMQAKGRRYSAADLLDDDELAARFDGGWFATLYLAPHNYHRIHAPVTGQIRRARHVPGRLLPVNTPAVRAVDRLFARNERLITLIRTGGEAGDEAGHEGLVAVVAVGAFNVGRITADFDEELVTNTRGSRAQTRVYHPSIPVERGDDLMAFHLGSTVVLLVDRGEPLSSLRTGHPVRLGQPLTAGRGPAGV